MIIIFLIVFLCVWFTVVLHLIEYMSIHTQIETDQDGWTALHFHCAKNRTKEVMDLIIRGASLDKATLSHEVTHKRSIYNRTALTICVLGRDSSNPLSSFLAH